MAMSLASSIRPITQFKVADVPVGKAITLSAAMGIGDVIKALVARFSGGKVPPIATGALLAWAMVNQKGLKNMLGADIAELSALAILADTLDDQVNVRQRTSDFLSRFFGGQTISKSPPVWHPATNSGAMPTAARSGDIYGRIF